MESFARTCPGTLLRIESIARPFSNFQFVESFWGITALRRIFSQVRRTGCNTLVVEHINASRDIADEDQKLLEALGIESLNSSDTFRFSYFKKKINDPSQLKEMHDDDFTGYAIIRKVDATPRWSHAWVYESAIRPERITNNFIRKAPIWNCEILGHPFQLQGYLYSQQNGITNCCAHVALRTAASSFALGGDISYSQMNAIIGGYSGKGLGAAQMVKILEEVGASCFVGNFDATLQEDDSFSIPFQKYIYGSIESGYPAIIFFGVGGQGEYHAIPIIGHTFNQDNWVPRAERGYFSIGEKIRYIPSESWLSMFIAHDDNFGSNYCIPRHYLHTGSRQSCEICKERSEPIHQQCVCHVIGTMPNNIKINPIEAEAIGADYLFELKKHLPTNIIWAKRLSDYAERNQLVLRPILVEKQEYVDHLSKISGWAYEKINSNILEVLKEKLDDKRYWLIEMSVSELFAANKRKLGEVLINATSEYVTERIFDSFVLARLPGYFAVFKEISEDNPCFNFIPSGINDHVELYGQEDNNL